jgi:hypothetical protein
MLYQNKSMYLSATGRPSQIGWWIGRSRPFDRTPEISNVAAYCKLYRNWYMRLQPSWRGTTWPLKRESVPNETWDALMRGGRNGVFNVVIALAWWRQICKTSKDKSIAEETMSDLLWVLDEMLSRAKVESTAEKRPALHDLIGGAATKKVKRG